MERLKRLLKKKDPWEGYDPDAPAQQPPTKKQLADEVEKMKMPQPPKALHRIIRVIMSMVAAFAVWVLVESLEYGNIITYRDTPALCIFLMVLLYLDARGIVKEMARNAEPST